MAVPSNLKYTADHEWLEIEDDHAVVGITAYAADALGDVVYVDLPKVGDNVSGGAPCGEIESTKSVSDLFAPADGEVIEVNNALENDPSAINDDPYQQGWIFRMRMSGSHGLLDAAEYETMTEGAG